MPPRNQVAAAAAAVAASTSTGSDAAAERPEWPKLVHAYRREPHMRLDPRTGLSEEVPVEVVFMGEKVKFLSNEAGHVVGEVMNKATYDRLTKEIPEAYIPYSGGENLPEVRPVAAEHQGESKPEGEFVLTGVNADGTKQYKVLDGMADEEVRAFAKEAGLADEQIPEVLTGETLQRCVFNLLAGA